MVRSMTGYGVESNKRENITYTVEIKSVNHRFLDIRFDLPDSLNFIEDKIKKVIQTYFERGRIEIHLKLLGESIENKTLVTNWSLIDQYVEQFELAKKRYNLEGNLPVHLLFSEPDVFVVQEDNDKVTELSTSILKIVDLVCRQVLEMRREEGMHLARDIKNRVTSVHDMLLLIEKRRPQVISDYRERIFQRIIDYTEKFIETDTQLIYQEIALLAEKGDISEEITRLKSHLNHFHELMKADEAIGKKLDFIIQEMHREMNTIGSKSKDDVISHQIVTMKSEIEKIKEQIQNIE